MSVDPANAHEFTRTASKTGVDALSGHYRRLSETAGQKPGDPHSREHLHRYRSQPMIMMAVPVCRAVPATWACGICDLLLIRRGEYLRCCVASPLRPTSHCSTPSSFRIAGSCRLPQGLWLTSPQKQRLSVDYHPFDLTKRRFR
jgi:hypothetical protein